MHRRTASLAGALAALSILALATPTATLAAATTDANSQFLTLLNADRTAAGLPPLAVDSTLSSIAQQRAQQELASGAISHYDSAGNLVFQGLLNASGVQYTSAGENLAANSYPASQTVTQANSALLASPPHAANILNPGYNAVGVAVTGPDASGNYYYTEIFGQLPQGASGGPAVASAPTTTAIGPSATTTTVGAAADVIAAGQTANTTTTTSTTTTATQTGDSGDDDKRGEGIEKHAEKELDRAQKLEDEAQKFLAKAEKMGDDRSDHFQQRAIQLESEATLLEAAAPKLQQLASQLVLLAQTNTSTQVVESHGPKGCAFGNEQAEGQTATAPGCAIAARQHEDDGHKAPVTTATGTAQSTSQTPATKIQVAPALAGPAFLKAHVAELGQHVAASVKQSVHSAEKPANSTAKSTQHGGEDAHSHKGH